MLKMRLQRIGRKNDPSYRVVVTDSRNGPRAGNHVDVLGSYNPKMHAFKIEGEKAKEWIAKGVQVSDTIHNLLISNKIIEGKKRNALPKKSPVINEAKVKAEAEAPAEEAAPEVVETPKPVEEAAPEVVETPKPVEEAAPEVVETPEVAPEADK